MRLQTEFVKVSGFAEPLLLCRFAAVFPVAGETRAVAHCRRNSSREQSAQRVRVHVH